MSLVLWPGIDVAPVTDSDNAHSGWTIDHDEVRQLTGMW